MVPLCPEGGKMAVGWTIPAHFVPKREVKKNNKQLTPAAEPTDRWCQTAAGGKKGEEIEDERGEGMKRGPSALKAAVVPLANCSLWAFPPPPPLALSFHLLQTGNIVNSHQQKVEQFFNSLTSIKQQ
ncbi:hypothetical protein niasHT_007991 [Heterodera trifolii]|uniref:Uncharacterized protein n=1 Tax=Heterodera trifolii TaxID=157864 RepID=A0ABD2M2P7_9BILA